MKESLQQVIDKLEQDGAKSVASDFSEKSVPLVKWLVFSVAKKKHAIYSSQVKEIINDVDIYRLPFVPDYIEGVINRRGEPYTVIDTALLLNIDEKPSEKKSLFLVIDVPNDQVCIRIENILVFYETEASAMKILKESENFYRGTIDLNGEEVPVLNIDFFEKQLKKDLDNIDG